MRFGHLNLHAENASQPCRYPTIRAIVRCDEWQIEDSASKGKHSGACHKPAEALSSFGREVTGTEPFQLGLTTEYITVKYVYPNPLITRILSISVPRTSEVRT